jgi:hypothetical protein
MIIGDDKAAKIQELLKQLSIADTFQSVAITREISEIATENSTSNSDLQQGIPSPSSRHKVSRALK